MLANIRFIFRALSKSPAFTITSILTLALGIGANAAIFSVIDAVLLQPLPYPDSSRLVELQQTSAQYPEMAVAYPDYLDWRANQRSLIDIAAYRMDHFNLTGDKEPERFRGAYVTASYFSVLGLRPELGRVFSEADDRKDSEPVVILGNKLWKKRFGADPDILGRKLVFNDISYEVIGVASARNVTPENTDLYVTFGPVSDRPPLSERGSHPGIRAIGRLRPGVSMAQATADFEVISRNLESKYPDTDTGLSVKVIPMIERVVGMYRPTLFLLAAVVLAVLFIACANVANLMLSRSMLRRKEIAVRAALGATRPQLIGLLLIESVGLAACGGLVGLLLAFWSIDLIKSIAPQGTIRFQELHLNGSVILFTGMLSLLAGILFGVIPAWNMSNAGDALKNAGGKSGTTGREHQRSQSSLVIGQVALACALLVGASLLVQSFRALQRIPLGFDPHNLATVDIKLAGVKYRNEPGQPPKKTEMALFYQQLQQKLQALPGIRSVAFGLNLPFGGDTWTNDFAITGRPDPRPGEAPSAQYSTVSPDYFRAMGIELVRGRPFNAEDTLDKPAVVIIDERFANRFFPGEDPIGKQLNDNARTGQRAQYTIVGVVRTVIHDTLGAEPSYVQYYMPVLQSPEQISTIIVRSENDPLPHVADIQRAVQAVDPDIPIFNVQTMDQRLANSLKTQHLAMTLVGLFSGLALILAAIGLYGVLGYSVVQRTREIGIRLALGATRANVLRLVVGKGMALVGMGLAFGIVLAFILGRLLTSFLHGVGATDPWTFLGVIGVLACTALLASWLPARRAIRIDPIHTLREE
jgi:putative ABC transport system permease protein